jgi:hypothetical protein
VSPTEPSRPTTPPLAAPQNSILWIQSWTTESPLQYFVSIAGLAAFALLHEALSGYRAVYNAGARQLSRAASDDGGYLPLGDEVARWAAPLPWRRAAARTLLRACHRCRITPCPGGLGPPCRARQEPACRRPCPLPPPCRGLRLSRHAVGSLMYTANIATSYLLMLAVMTFNGGYFVTVVLSMGLGHFLFARKAGQLGLLRQDPCCDVPISGS